MYAAAKLHVQCGVLFGRCSKHVTKSVQAHVGVANLCVHFADLPTRCKEASRTIQTCLNAIDVQTRGKASKPFMVYCLSQVAILRIHSM